LRPSAPAGSPEPAGGLQLNWSKQLAAERITAGCGDGNYRTANPVTRAQMAVFLLKVKYGSSYVPPACAASSATCLARALFADWIE